MKNLLAAQLGRRLVGLASAAIALFVFACSSDSTSSSGGDAGTADGGTTSDSGASALPSCVTSGFQCQPKGCNTGYQPLPGYDCGSTGGSCCGKSVPSLDASTSGDATSD